MEVAACEAGEGMVGPEKTCVCVEKSGVRGFK
jgi:hypothetical protein